VSGDFTKLPRAATITSLFSNESWESGGVLAEWDMSCDNAWMGKQIGWTRDQQSVALRLYMGPPDLISKFGVDRPFELTG